MSLNTPAYLISLRSNIRARPIPWEGAVRAGTIQEQDLKAIRAVDKVRVEQRRQTLEADPAAYRALLLGGDDGRKGIFEAAAKRADVIQYMLVLTGDLLSDCPSLVTELFRHPDPYRVILPLLSQSNTTEDPVPLLAASVLTVICAAAHRNSRKLSTQDDDALLKLYSYLSRLAKHQDSGLKDIAMQLYADLVISHRARELFWQQQDQNLAPTMQVLQEAAGASQEGNSISKSSAASLHTTCDAIGGNVSLQLLYHVLLVVWQLSFDAKLVSKDLQSHHDIITLYTHLLRISPKEKTTRLLLATLRNLFSPSNTARASLLSMAITARLSSTIQNLKTRHLTDPDLLEDLDMVKTTLDEYASSQSTIDEYSAEIGSGRLRWTPAHRDAEFWKKYARAIIEKENGALVAGLATILSKEWNEDKSVLAVACNDVAWLVKEAPEQRAQLEKAGLKVRVMALMQDRNEGVRWESLRAVGEWLRYSFDK